MVYKGRARLTRRGVESDDYGYLWGNGEGKGVLCFGGAGWDRWRNGDGEDDFDDGNNLFT